MTQPAVSKMLSQSKAARCIAIMNRLLAPGEQLLALADVTSVKPLTLGLAVTDQRILGVPKSAEHPVELSFRHGSLREYSYDKRLVFSYLICATDAGLLDFGIVLSDDRTFLDPYLLQSVRMAPPVPPAGGPSGHTAAPPPSAHQSGVDLVKKTPPPGPQTEQTIADELVKLADLHQRGLLTDEEFQSAKAAVIHRAG
ncbi:SHOCT domain-containing protein [Gordonia sp. (in: high G+C Gram-positive bacteria)]|uniref:SHOCT domain-containing protein n=1 Tax=Gordonia sp. (in: high G+C Gram-positive bacteria) TaxID=84139 RepID=UPI0039E3908C